MHIKPFSTLSYRCSICYYTYYVSCLEDAKKLKQNVAALEDKNHTSSGLYTDKHNTEVAEAMLEKCDNAMIRDHMRKLSETVGSVSRKT